MALLSRILEQSFRLSHLEYQVEIYCQLALYTVVLLDKLSIFVTKFNQKRLLFIVNYWLTACNLLI